MSSDRSRLTLVQLAWPILVENLLRTSLMSVDTLMLGRYSATAVASMSLVNTFCFFIQLLYMVVSIGASILIAQNLGARQTREAGLIAVGSLVLIGALSLVVSMLVAVGSLPLIRLYHLEPEVERGAWQFLALYGGLSCFMALNIAQSTLLRAWGHTLDPMVVNVLGLVLTVVGNAVALFGPASLPVHGITGVALSTVLSQVVAVGVNAWLIRRRRLDLPFSELRRIPARVYRAMLAVGIPTAGENLSYNLSQIAILAMLSRLGTASLATYGILMAVLRYVFMPGVSIGMGAQLKVGYLVGAGRADDATMRVQRYFAIAFGISAVAAMAVQVVHGALLRLFTDDPVVLELASSVLLVALVHEPGRNFNTVIIPALKGAGDVRFPVYVGIVSMWGVGVLGAWFLGLHLGYGLPGVWAAMAADEWLRGLVMLWRWRSGAWKSMSLLRAGEGDAALESQVQVGEGS